MSEDSFLYTQRRTQIFLKDIIERYCEIIIVDALRILHGSSII